MYQSVVEARRDRRERACINPWVKRVVIEGSEHELALSGKA
jgi:hypothetical protein